MNDTTNHEGDIMYNVRLLALTGTSILALATSMSAYAQDQEELDEAQEVEEIVVKGMRQSLLTAQSIKRDSDTFVDSITASDIGALPDRSVLEALQRVPGVSISRFAANDDPDHFSVEGSGLVIRGLSHVRSEFNGRDAFTSDNGRALSFQDVPPELMGGVDVYKNQTADMIEGGIAGVVNLRTLKPFDSEGQVISLSADATYSDMRGKTSPTFSGLYTNRWDVSGGEFGFLANVAYSELKSRSDGYQMAPLYPYNSTFSGAGDELASDNIGAPAGANIRRQDFDRKRLGIALAGQWASDDGTKEATVQFIRSDASNAWTEHTLQSEEGPGDRAGNFAIGAFGSDSISGASVFAQRDDLTPIPLGGLFTNGVLTNEGAGWTGRHGIRMAHFTRGADTDNVTTDIGFNFKFTPNDQLRLSFDAQYVDATTKNQDLSIFAASMMDIALDLTGSAPTIGYQQNTGNGYGLTDPESTYWRAAMDHYEDSEGDEISFRADAEYDFGDQDGWFKSVRAGGRYAKRQQTTRWTEYNWGHISEAWAGGEVDFNTGSGSTELFTFDNFSRGGVLTGANAFLFPAVSLVTDRDAFTAFFDGNSNFPNEGWNPRAATSRDSLFEDSEISNVSEETFAGYTRLDFGQDTENGAFSGNIGVRIIHTKNTSHGFLTYEGLSGAGAAFVAADDPALASFYNDSTPIERAVKASYTDFLPSFNMKYSLDNGVVFRFAASKAISRPEVGLLRAWRRLDAGITTDDGGVPGNIDSYTSVPTVSGGNPFLKPVRATNIDASVEYYFSENAVGSVTMSVFYKKLNDIIVSGSEPTEGFSYSDGRDVEFQYYGAVNGGDGEIKGFEFAYQQFYDFLPGWMSGLGMQATYTYVDQNRIPNAGTRNVGGTGVAEGDAVLSPNSLEQLSKHTINVAAMYQKDRIEARIAYNWRSDYLLTLRDVISRLPIYDESQGQVDASIFYDINDNFKVGVQGVNLLSAETRTSMQYDESDHRFLRSIFENDRRVSFIVRAKF